jgi:hypothetical protein
MPAIRIFDKSVEHHDELWTGIHIIKDFEIDLKQNGAADKIAGEAAIVSKAYSREIREKY